MALSPRKTAFINYYIIKGWNATDAAKKAGYSEKTAYSIGSRLLKNVEVSEEIDKRLNELTMSASEALFRLNQHAKGDLGQFIDLSMEELRDHEQSHILKKVRVKTVTYKNKDKPDEIEHTMELELYDAQSALKEILKIRRIDMGKPTESTQHNHTVKFSNLSDDELDNLIQD